MNIRPSRGLEQRGLIPSDVALSCMLDAVVSSGQARPRPHRITRWWQVAMGAIGAMGAPAMLGYPSGCSQLVYQHPFMWR